MKAEHRKELETNLLADRMGSLIQKMKGGPKRRSIVYVFVIVLVVIVLFIGYRFWSMGDAQATDRWIKLDRGEVLELANDPEDNNTRKAARLQLAQFQLWNGVRMLASQPMGKDMEGRKIPGALDLIDLAKSEYKSLLEDCKNDKEWLAEAEYGLAVVEETLASVDIKKLASAKEKFEEVAANFEGTTHGALAKLRAKDLTDNNAKLTAFYTDLNKKFNLALFDQIRINQAQLNQKMPRIGPK